MGLHVALWGHSCPSVNLTGRVEGRRNKLAPTVAKFMAHLSSTRPVRCIFLCSSLVHHGHHCLHPMNKSWPSSARSSPRQLIAGKLAMANTNRSHLGPKYTLPPGHRCIATTRTHRRHRQLGPMLQTCGVLALARRSQSYLSVAQSNCGSASFCRSRKI